MDMAAGMRLGQFEICEVIRSGKLSTIYKAAQPSLGRFVAMKVLHAVTDPHIVARFQSEARAIARLAHPNILPIYDYGEQDGCLYLVTQYIDGGTSLADLLTTAMEPPTAIQLAERVLDALHHAHQHGVVHRDVKPSNILMPSPTWPLLADFGIAKLITDTANPELTQEEFIVGTAAYMAPEQALGLALDARTDVYALGVVLYEMVTGQVPFDADTPTAALLHHAYEPPPPPRSIAPNLPASLEAVLLHALAKEPSDRYQTAAAMHHALKDLRLGSPVPSPALQTASLYASAVEAFRNESWDPAIERPAPVPTAGVRAAADEPRHVRLVIGGTALVLFAVVVAMVFVALRPDKLLPAASPQEAESSLRIPSSENASIPGQPDLGRVRFSDGNGPLDTAIFTAVRLPPPPKGMRYEAWLLDTATGERRSMGIVQAGGGRASAELRGDGSNLLASFDAFEITVEPGADSNRSTSNDVAFKSALPPKAAVHIRNLLVAFDGAPGRVSLTSGLVKALGTAQRETELMLGAQWAGDLTAMKRHAEAVVNLIEGSGGARYADHDGDENITKAGDGFGLLDDSSGYLDAIQREARLAAAAPDATSPIALHAGHVAAAAEGLTRKVTKLRDLSLTVAAAGSIDQVRGTVDQAAGLAAQLMAGQSDGAQTVSQFARSLADLAITH